MSCGSGKPSDSSERPPDQAGARFTVTDVLRSHAIASAAELAGTGQEQR